MCTLLPARKTMVPQSICALSQVPSSWQLVHRHRDRPKDACWPAMKAFVAIRRAPDAGASHVMLGSERAANLLWAWCLTTKLISCANSASTEASWLLKMPLLESCYCLVHSQCTNPLNDLFGIDTAQVVPTLWFPTMHGGVEACCGNEMQLSPVLPASKTMQKTSDPTPSGMFSISTAAWLKVSGVSERLKPGTLLFGTTKKSSAPSTNCAGKQIVGAAARVFFYSQSF